MAVKHSQGKGLAKKKKVLAGAGCGKFVLESEVKKHVILLLTRFWGERTKG